MIAHSYPLLDSWERSLLARNRSHATIASYRNDCTKLADFLDGKDFAAATKADLEGFLAAERARGKAAATVARRFRSMQQFYAWLTDEGEIEHNPMARMKPPAVPVQPPPILSDDTFNALLKVCNGRDFEHLRDTAMIRLLESTGIRAGELMGLTLADVDLRTGLFEVLGKGRRRRVVAMMPKALEAVDRYVRARRRHPDAASTALWLGKKGQLTQSGLTQLLDRRSIAAGITPSINPHAFRHRFAHTSKARGMSDGDLMSIAGWNSPQMLQRYGASAASERGREAHRRIMGDR